VCCELAPNDGYPRCKVASGHSYLGYSNESRLLKCIRQCARAPRRSLARARARANRRARSSDGKARSGLVRSPWMRSQPQHYIACVGTCSVPGIVFPTGGQGADRATGHRNLIYRQQGPKPWRVTLSYGPALQHPVFEAWAGCDVNLEAADQALSSRASFNAAASVGKSMDETASPDFMYR
jgi:hypothetical protein